MPDMENLNLSEKLRSLRKARFITQSKLDEMAGLPISSTSKIEHKKREMTASELIRIAKALKVRLTAFLDREIYICNEEIRVIQALRVIPFEDYRRLITTLESQVYFASKDMEGKKKEWMKNLVTILSKLSVEDKRPKEENLERQRIRHTKKKQEEIRI